MFLIGVLVGSLLFQTTVSAADPQRAKCRKSAVTVVVAPIQRKTDPGLYFATATVGREQFFAKGSLSNGVLELNLSLVGHKGRRVKDFRGRDEFDRILDHFGHSVRVIKGDWVRRLGQTDNLDEFNAGIATGIPPESAALQTWTGRQAARRGFGRVKIKVLDGLPPYDEVEVLFYRDASANIN